MALAGVGTLSILATSTWQSWPACLPMVLVGYAAWLMFWLPRVVVHEGGVTLVNPLQTLLVSWSSIIMVDTKYAMTLVTPKRRYTAWAAPAPGVISALRDARSSAKSERRDGSGGRYRSVRPGDQSSSDSGAVAAVVRGRLERLAEAGALDIEATENAKAVRSIHWLHIGILLVLLVLSLTIPAVLV